MTPPSRRAIIALLALVIIASGCAKQRAQVVKASASLEQTLGTLQDAVRHICNPSVAFPTPITDCTAESASLGLTTAKFRQISAALAKAFDFIYQTLAPALRLWKAGDPVPKEYGQVFALVDEAVRVIRTAVTSPKAQPVFDAITLVAAALSGLGDRLTGGLEVSQ